MKSVVIAVASLLASASAFAPAQQGSRVSSSLNEFVRGYPGADSVEPMFIGETGSKNFDPAGFSEVRYDLLILQETREKLMEQHSPLLDFFLRRTLEFELGTHLVHFFASVSPSVFR